MFDPYHKWLGIPPGENPPTLYQILGISPIELDSEVIEGGADRASRHVQEFQSGPHAKEASRVLAEIAFARRTLVDSAKRAIYDATLRAEETIRKGPAPKVRPNQPGRFWRARGYFFAFALGISVAASFFAAGRVRPVTPGKPTPAPTSERKVVPVPDNLPAAKVEPVASAPPVQVTPPTATPAREPADGQGERWLKDGIAAESAGDVHTAIACYSRAIRSRPGSDAAYNHRAWLLVNAGFIGPALADYDAAVEIDPESTWHHTGRGIARYKVGDIPGAIEDYTRAIEIDPDAASAYLHRSWAYRKRGDSALADADRAKALTLEPGQAASDVMYR